MSTSAMSGFFCSLLVAVRSRASPASSSARSVEGTSIPGGGTGFDAGCAESSEAASGKTQSTHLILPLLSYSSNGLLRPEFRDGPRGAFLPLSSTSMAQEIGHLASGRQSARPSLKPQNMDFVAQALSSAFATHGSRSDYPITAKLFRLRNNPKVWLGRLPPIGILLSGLVVRYRGQYDDIFTRFPIDRRGDFV